MNIQGKNLYRSRKNRMLGGVAGGLGEFFGIDPTLVRLLFVLLGIVGWVAPAVVAYVVMLFIVPEEPLPGGEPGIPPVEPTEPPAAEQDE